MYPEYNEGEMYLDGQHTELCHGEGPTQRGDFAAGQKHANH